MIQVRCCVAAGSDGVSVNECKNPEMNSFAKSRLHVGKLAPSRKYTGNCDGELEFPNDKFIVLLLLFTENYLMESIFVKQRLFSKTWKRLKLQ